MGYNYKFNIIIPEPLIGECQVPSKFSFLPFHQEFKTSLLHIWSIYCSYSIYFSWSFWLLLFSIWENKHMPSSPYPQCLPDSYSKNLVYSFPWCLLTSIPIGTGFLIFRPWLSCATFLFPELSNCPFFPMPLSYTQVFQVSSHFNHSMEYFFNVLSQSPLSSRIGFDWSLGLM